jgi:hypothetical protein
MFEVEMMIPKVAAARGNISLSQDYQSCGSMEKQATNPMGLDVVSNFVGQRVCAILAQPRRLFRMVRLAPWKSGRHLLHAGMNSRFFMQEGICVFVMLNEEIL